jgi:gas vesicle protein
MKGVYYMRIVTGIVAGAVIGTAAAAMMNSRMSRKTKRMLGRTGRRVSNVAGDMFDGLVGFMK